MTHRWPKRVASIAAAFALFVSVAAASLATAAEPQFSGMSPYGFQRGTEVEATFVGSRLADAQQLLLYSPGVEVTKITPVNDGSFKAKLKITPIAAWAFMRCEYAPRPA